MNTFLKSTYVLPIVLLTALALVTIVLKTRSAIEHETPQYPVKDVEYINVKKIPFRTQATAYGYVEPSVFFNAKTEVGGKISYIHPSLKKGASLLKDTVVLRIEPTTFEFSLDQSKAGLVGSQSSLDQLAVEESSTRKTLDLAEKNLLAGERELARILTVWDKRLVARSVVDAEEQKVLQLRQQTEDLKGRLASYNSRKSVIQAQVTQSQTKLAQSEDTLGRTEIRLPFDARIGQVFAEAGEYVALGAQLFEALGTEAIEIDAQLPIGQFYPLLMGVGKETMKLNKFEDFQSALAKFQFETNVRLIDNDDVAATWSGNVIRISESVDPLRDTIGLVIAVDHPYEGIIPGRRPPLLKGMYTAVEIMTPPRSMMVLPRKAIHEGRVYLVKEDVVKDDVVKNDDELEIREIEILHRQGELVIVESGKGKPKSIQAGERVIISDVIPVIDGLPIRLHHAAVYEAQMRKLALGEGPKK